MSIYGYVRVSSTDQNEDRQMIALREVPVPEKNIFIMKNIRMGLGMMAVGKIARFSVNGVNTVLPLLHRQKTTMKQTLLLESIWPPLQKQQKQDSVYVQLNKYPTIKQPMSRFLF